MLRVRIWMVLAVILVGHGAEAQWWMPLRAPFRIPRLPPGSHGLRAAKDILARHQGEIQRLTKESQAAKDEIGRIKETAASQGRRPSSDENSALARRALENQQRAEKIRELEEHSKGLRRDIDKWEREGLRPASDAEWAT